VRVTYATRLFFDLATLDRMYEAPHYSLSHNPKKPQLNRQKQAINYDDHRNLSLNFRLLKSAFPAVIRITSFEGKQEGWSA
jgi:hypothetical protein